MSSKSALSFPSFAEGKDTEPTQNVGEETVETNHAVANETVEFGQSDIGNVVELGRIFFEKFWSEECISAFKTFKACGPDPSDIWNFAYRTSTVTRKPNLQDLPEAIVKTLNDFMLDAHDLGIEDLQGYRLDAIKSSRSSYWISLGKSEEEREKRSNFLLERKTVYCSQIRICIAEALEDIRYYRFYQGKLVPPKKYKTSQVGFGKEDEARMTKLEWRRQALHMKEI